AAPPSAPKPYKAVEVQNLPVQNLDQPLTPVVQSDSVTFVASEVTEEPTTVVSFEAATSVPDTAIFTSVPATDTEVPVATATDTDVPQPTVEPNTLVPTEEPSLTPEPPTDVPPTDVPPTAVPPTDVPPTADVSGQSLDTNPSTGDAPTSEPPPAST